MRGFKANRAQKKSTSDTLELSGIFDGQVVRTEIIDAGCI